MMDRTAYDSTGEAVSQPRMYTRSSHGAFYVRSVPVLYLPWLQGDAERGHTALRSIRVGPDAEHGFTVATKWSLFKLFGMETPEGFNGRLYLNYRGGPEAGAEIEYARRTYSGYGKAWGMMDDEGEDEFGRQNNPDAPSERGRVLWRHKQFLPRDWQVQAEFSYLSDRNYLRSFFPAEFYGGKEQETLLYAKKQRDNWAIDVLAQVRINSFLTQTESAPDISGRIYGEPLLGDLLTGFAEAHAGIKRYRPGDGSMYSEGSDWMGRANIRGEVDWPINVGQVHVVPYAAGRADYWSQAPAGGTNNNVYGELGVRATTQLWRIYQGVRSRLWDLNMLKHIVAPEIAGMLAAGTATPDELYPMSPAIEQNIEGFSGITFGLRQRLQTRRGAPGQQRTVNWMRLDVMAGFFNADEDFHPSADGRYYTSRPEFSLARNFINFDYTWHIAESTTLLADMNIDLDEGNVGRSGIGLAVDRGERLDYYLGLRTIRDLDATVLTFGARYKINRKYTVTFIEQYDLEYDGGISLLTRLKIVRKFPRWYVGMEISYDRRYEDFTVMLTFWPEGIPEAGFETGEFSLFGRSEDN
jgi:hypothetical protein